MYSTIMSKYFKFPRTIINRDEELFHDHTQEALERYFVHGLPPGSFVEAVLVGDLFSATMKADHWNKKSLAAIASWIVYNAPEGSYGSWQNVSAWIDDVDGRRSKWVAFREKEIAWELLKENENA